LLGGPSFATCDSEKTSANSSASLAAAAQGSRETSPAPRIHSLGYMEHSVYHN